MKTRIELQIASVPGIQLKVITALKPVGLVCTRYSAKEAEFDATRMLKLEFDGERVPEAEIQSCLRAVNGIHNVDRIVYFEGDEPEPDPPLHETEEISEEGGDHEIRDRMLAFSLLSRYPKVAGRVHELVTSIPEGERNQRMREIGQTFGKYLAPQQKKDGACNSIETAIDNLILPAISPLAELTYSSDTINVTQSKINLKPDQPQAECCAFLHGCLEGLLGTESSVASVKVTKETCVTEGHSECRYRFQA